MNISLPESTTFGNHPTYECKPYIVWNQHSNTLSCIISKGKYSALVALVLLKNKCTIITYGSFLSPGLMKFGESPNILMQTGYDVESRLKYIKLYIRPKETLCTSKHLYHYNTT